MKERIVPLKYDLMAKRVFGDQSDIRPIKFLIKQILDIEVERVKILNNELIDRPYIDKKYSVDLMVEIEDKRIVIEINTDVNSKITDRNIFYMARVMSKDIEVGEDYSKLHRHIQINFDFKGYHERPIMEYRLIDKESGKVLTDKIEIIRIDVPYFYDRCYNKGASIKEKFIGLFNEEDKEMVKKLVVGNNDMEVIYDKMDEYSDEIIGLYDVEARRRYNEESVIEEARETGIKQGIEQGIKQGIKQGIEQGAKERTLLLVKNMLNENIDIKIISKVSGLSIDEISKLKK